MSTRDRFYLNKLFYDTQQADALAAYQRDPAGYLADYPLSAEARAAVEGNDIAALYRTGVNPYLLRYYCVNMRVPDEAFLGALAGLRKAES